MREYFHSPLCKDEVPKSENLNKKILTDSTVPAGSIVIRIPCFFGLI